MARPRPDKGLSEFNERRRIVVIYEDGAARAHAFQVAPKLPQPGRRETRSIVQWWSFSKLAQPAPASEAAAKAAGADIVIFALSPGGDLPGDIKLWIESWIPKRSEREGTIVGLLARTAGSCEIAGLKEVYLRNAAHRAGMDYLSEFPSGVAKVLPDSLDSYRERAGQVTSLLDDILRTSLPPPGAAL